MSAKGKVILQFNINFLCILCSRINVGMRNLQLLIINVQMYTDRMFGVMFLVSQKYVEANEVKDLRVK